MRVNLTKSLASLFTSLSLGCVACGGDPFAVSEKNDEPDASFSAEGGADEESTTDSGTRSSDNATDDFQTISRLVETSTLDDRTVEFTCEVTYRFRVPVEGSILATEEENEQHTVRVFTQDAGDRAISLLRLSEITGNDEFLSSEMLDALRLRTNDFGYYKDKVDYSRMDCRDVKAEALPVNSTMTDPEGLCLSPSELDDYLKDRTISGPQLVKTSTTHWVCKYSSGGAITLTVDTATTLDQFTATKTMRSGAIHILKDEANFYGTEVYERKSTAVFGWQNGASISVEAAASTDNLLAVAKALFARL